MSATLPGIDTGIEGAVDALYENARSYNASAIALNINKDLNEELWLAARTRTIGSSSSAPALGVSKYESPYQAWLEMTGQIKRRDISNKPAVKAGNMLEQVLRDWFAAETNRDVERVNEMLVSKPFPWMHSNLDGRIVGEAAGLECKTAGHWAGLSEEWGPSGSSDTDAVPLAYLTQCIHDMIVTGWKKWYLAVLIGGQDFRWYTINWDPVVAEQIVDGLKEFKEKVDQARRYLAEGKQVPDRFIPPPTMMDDVFARWPDSQPKPIMATREIADLVDEYAKLKRVVKADEERLDEIKLEVGTFMADCDTLQYQAASMREPVTLATFRTTKQRALFDAKSHLKDEPICHARYASLGAKSRSFLLKAEAG